ncbi:ABC transporter ATP-binding protein [Candidatus Bathyarchaeota archaeon]|nr:ABC transporter ATP-binding protein [Candidatus Bathyarchaeota archaeon]
MSSSETVLEVSNLTKVYGRDLEIAGRKLGRRVVGAQDVSFSVRRGEIFGFLGPNGAGKTTTMRAILDYLHIQEGTITVFGMDHHRDALKIRSRIGYVPGDLSLYDNFNGNELIDYFGGFRPVNSEYLKELRSVFRVDLTLNVKALSSGNRQQVGLILALASKPDFLILDEPTSGLDPLMAANAHRLLKELKAEGKTIFLSSHDLAEVQAVCDRIGIIKEGRMILVEEVENLVSKFLQNVRVSFTSEVPPLETLEAIDSVISAEAEDEDTLLLKVKEDINELLKVLTNYELDRLSIEDATLEEIFLQYYE